MSLRVLVIIPAYNEEDAILSTVQSVEKLGYDYVVINDGSKDNTLTTCRAHGVHVIDLPQNLGIGGAVQTGHKWAERHNYDVDIQIDGDGQHDPSFIPQMVEHIEQGADLVIGSRFVEKSEGFQSTFMRRVGIVWLSSWIRLFAGKRIMDPTSGLRACGRKAIKMYAASYPIDYPEPESITTAVKKGLKVEEVPVVMRERQGGSSSIGGFSAIYYMVKVSVAITLASLTRRS